MTDALVAGMQAVAIFARLARQAALHRVVDELMDRARFAEAHLDLGRVHVDVDQLGRQVQAQHVRRETVAVQHVLIGAAHRVRQQLVADEAAIDEEELLVGAAARGGRQSGEAVQRELAGLFFQRQPRPREFVAEHLRGTRGDIARVPVLHRLAVVMDRQRDVGPGQRDAPDHLEAMAELGLFALQELAAGRRIEIQVLHIDGGADPARGGLQRAGVRMDLAGVGGSSPCGWSAPAARRRRSMPAPRRESPASAPIRVHRARRSCWWRGASARPPVPRPGCRSRCR
ncbi:hypothetical protein OJJOAM_002425 [Cupriavidus sp. H18C1]